MHCKNCGNEVVENALACLRCGCDPAKGNKNCPSCGVETNPEQIICIKCGVGLKINNPSSDQDRAKTPSDGDKTVAILSYITLVGFIIAIIQHNNNKTKLGAYHLRQAVGLICTSVALVIFLYLLALPMFGMSFRDALDYATFLSIISFLIWSGLLVLLIFGIVNASRGQEKPIPLFGKLFQKWFANMFR